MSDVIVTTMNDLPGYRVAEVYGEVFGLTVRSRNIGSDIGASLKGLIGGEVKGYTKMLADSRLQARSANSGWALIPVPTAVPPSGTDSSSTWAARARRRDSSTWPAYPRNS